MPVIPLIDLSTKGAVQRAKLVACCATTICGEDSWSYWEDVQNFTVQIKIRALCQMIILKDRYLSKIETFYVEVKILILAKSEEIGITAEMKKAVFNLFFNPKLLQFRHSFLKNCTLVSQNLINSTLFPTVFLTGLLSLLIIIITVVYYYYNYWLY